MLTDVCLLSREDNNQESEKNIGKKLEQAFHDFHKRGSNQISQ